MFRVCSGLPVVNTVPAQVESPGIASSANEKYALLVFRKGATPGSIPLSSDNQPPAAELSVFQGGTLVPTSLGTLRWLPVA